MSGPSEESGWTSLFRTACRLIAEVNAEHPIIDDWSFGGGTAMMIQIDHRDSRDVDIFLPDAQLLAYLDPGKRDFTFGQPLLSYGGDGTRFLKLSFDAGEIDFIAGNFLTEQPTRSVEVEGTRTCLETIPEIIAKKIVYRGRSIKPRDIFDIAAAAETDDGALRSALKAHRGAVEATIVCLDRLNPSFVEAAIADLMIREQFRRVARTALARASAFLRSV